MFNLITRPRRNRELVSFTTPALVLTAFAAPAVAATVTGGSLTDPEATQIETWIGDGVRDFTHIWTGAAGVATSASFHSAADGVGPTLSIYAITLGDGSTAKIGGFTTADWGGDSYGYDPAAFIFNLTTGEVQTAQEHLLSIFRQDDHFATFGYGDLSVGTSILGTCDGALDAAYCTGSSSSFQFDQSQGQITVAGDSGIGHGDSGLLNSHWSVNALEVYTVAPISAVPLPAGLPMLCAAFAVFGLLRQRKARKNCH